MNTNVKVETKLVSMEEALAAVEARRAANIAANLGAPAQRRSGHPAAPLKEEKGNIPAEGEMTGFQHVTAGTEAVQSRDEAGTVAGTPIPPSPQKEKDPRPNPATHSPLDDLPPAVYGKLLRLIETKTYDEALEAATAPPPYGLGIQTSRSSLERLAKRHRASFVARHRDDFAAAIPEILQNATASDEEFSRAAVHLLRYHLLRHAMVHTTSPDKILMLSRVLDRLRSADFAERRLRLAESKIQKPPTKAS